MNQRALSKIGSPILIEDAMLYDEVLKDNTALRDANARMLAALKQIRDERQWPWGHSAVMTATVAIQQVEGC